MKVITFNLRHDADRWEARFPLIMSELAAEQADIVALQEVAIRIGQAHLIRANLAPVGLNYRVKVAPKWTRPWLPVFFELLLRQHEGIGILSQHPILSYRRLVLSEGKRVAQHVQIEVEGKRVNILNTHLHHKPLLDDVIRIQQMREILGYIEKIGERGWILVGDFNALPHSEVLKLTEARFQSAFEIAGLAEPQYTFPTPLVAHKDVDFPNVRIDYVLCERGAFEVSDARVIFNSAHPEDATLFASDHFGLVARVEPH